MRALGCLLQIVLFIILFPIIAALPPVGLAIFVALVVAGNSLQKGS